MISSSHRRSESNNCYNANDNITATTVKNPAIAQQKRISTRKARSSKTSWHIFIVQVIPIITLVLFQLIRLSQGEDADDLDEYDYDYDAENADAENDYNYQNDVAADDAVVDDAAATAADDVYRNYYAADDDVYDDLVNSTDGELDYILYYPTPPISYSGEWTLIIYSTVVTLLRFITLFYAFLFIHKWYRYVSKICYCDGIKVDGMTRRRGRVFNPFRFLLPTRYNCYVVAQYTIPEVHDENNTVMRMRLYDGENDSSPPPGGAIMRKEFCLEEKNYLELMQKQHSNTNGNTDESRTQLQSNSIIPVEVYTLPGYPKSGCLSEGQATELGTSAKVLYGIASFLLIGVGLYVSVANALPSFYDDIYDSDATLNYNNGENNNNNNGNDDADQQQEAPPSREIVISTIVFLHLLAAILAYWANHFAHHNRVEALLHHETTETSPVQSIVMGGCDRGKQSATMHLAEVGDDDVNVFSNLEMTDAAAMNRNGNGRVEGICGSTADVYEPPIIESQNVVHPPVVEKIEESSQPTSSDNIGSSGNNTKNNDTEIV